MKRINPLIDWLLFALVAFVVVFTFVANARSDDSTDYAARAKAAIAINLTLSTGGRGGMDAAPPVVPMTPQPSKPKAARPTIQVFYAPFPCPPCDAQKADFATWTNPPFLVETPPHDKCPVEIKSYPLTVWKAGGRWWYVEGWNGRKDLEGRWRATQREGEKLGATAAISSSRTSLRIVSHTWPGDLRTHLRTVHGVTEALTHEQAELVHNAIHSGYSIEQIRTYARQRGLIR